MKVPGLLPAWLREPCRRNVEAAWTRASCLHQSRAPLQRYRSNPSSTPGTETRLGDAKASSHPPRDEQSIWCPGLTSVCSCQGSTWQGSSRTGCWWKGCVQRKCHRQGLALGRSKRETLGKLLLCFTCMKQGAQLTPRHQRSPSGCPRPTSP